MTSAQQPAADPQVIRYTGRIAPGVTIEFRFDMTTGEIASAVHGDSRRSPRAELLRRYRAVRHGFLERIAAATGKRIAIVEINEHNNADTFHVVDVPAAGRA